MRHFEEWTSGGGCRSADVKGSRRLGNSAFTHYWDYEHGGAVVWMSY